MELYSCGYEITDDRTGVIAPVDVIKSWVRLNSKAKISIAAINAQIDLRGLILDSYKSGCKDYFVPYRYLITLCNELASNTELQFDIDRAKYRTAFVMSIDRFMKDYNPVYWKGFLYSLAFMN